MDKEPILVYPTLHYQNGGILINPDAATNIPVIIINGEKRGPVLALVSGAHGTEYTSIIAIEKLINLLDPSQIAGSVIVVPLVNIQSFEQKAPPL